MNPFKWFGKKREHASDTERPLKKLLGEEAVGHDRHFYFLRALDDPEQEFSRMVERLSNARSLRSKNIMVDPLVGIDHYV